MSVRIVTKNAVLSRLLAKVLHSSENFNIEFLQADDGIDLLIYDIGEDVEYDFGQIHSLMARNKAAKVFLTSTNPDPSVLMQAIRIGAKEFFPQPLDVDELRGALERLNIGQSARLGEVFTVMGCKGGVGTTCVAVNLAVALKRLKQSATVALVDMNLVFGEIPLFLNFKPRYTWGEVAKHINRMDDVFLNDNLFEHSTGIHVLPSPSMWKNSDEATPPIFMRILSHMRRLFDFIIIDAGHSFSDMSMKTLENSNHVFLVSLLSLPCLTNTSKLLGAFDSWGYPQPCNTHVIINRYLHDSDITLEDCEQTLNKKVAWKFPNDYSLTMSAINQGRALFEVNEKAALTKSFFSFAQECISSNPVRAGEQKKNVANLPIWKTLFRGAYS
jgi:pilus assembly protein CpaE